MSFLGDLKHLVGKVGNLGTRARDERWARQEKTEDDTEPDRAVAGNRAKRDGEDGSYVGRTNPQYDGETQESGAEARAEADRDQ